jgi:hypothetical protein
MQTTSNATRKDQSTDVFFTKGSLNVLIYMHRYNDTI